MKVGETWGKLLIIARVDNSTSAIVGGLSASISHFLSALQHAGGPLVQLCMKCSLVTLRSTPMIQ